MDIHKIKIGDEGATLTCYIQKGTDAVALSKKRPAVLIFPGGGYEVVSDPENEPVALAYAAKGFQTFVLEYTVKEKGYFPMPQKQALSAMIHIRENAEQYFVDLQKIAVLGFSAGGHLAGSVGVHYDLDGLGGGESARPNAMVLVYPCITGGVYAYEGLHRVHGAQLKGDDKKKYISLENYVTEKTPPAFICHTAADTCVPPMNALLFAEQLSKRNVPFELHIYKDGPHGMSLGTKAVSSPYVNELNEQDRNYVKKAAQRFSDWFNKSIEFLQNVFGE